MGVFDVLLATRAKDRVARAEAVGGPLSAERAAWVERVRAGAATYKGKHVQFAWYCCKRQFDQHLQVMDEVEKRRAKGDDCNVVVPDYHPECMAIVLAELAALGLEPTHETMYLRPCGLTEQDLAAATGRAELREHHGQPARLE